MKKKYIWISELIWWIVSALIAVAVVWPYYPALIVEVPFLVPNMVMIVLMIQCIRLTFFLRQSPWPSFRWMIFVLNFAFIPFSMYVIKHYSGMSQFFESSSWMHSFSYLLTLTEKSDLASYIRTEFTFVSVVAFISGFSFSSRMVVASWRILSRSKRI